MSELTSAWLSSLGVEHGFGTRDAPERAVVRPVQVHGTHIVRARGAGDALGEADGIVCSEPDVPVAIVTADCVPVLLASGEGAAVAAVHAGWRGLAAGVLEAGVAALRRVSDAELSAAIGPAAGACCYEVDAPVIDALTRAYPDHASGRLRPAREGHAMADLAGLAGDALRASGIAGSRIDALDVCTICDAERFHSYRRDGAGAGRLCHWIVAT